MSDYGQIDDGFGSIWPLCKPGCQLQIVRPGKVQCACDYDDVASALDLDDPRHDANVVPCED